ncbi:MAG TPA: glycerophosphodiester phosphodiesterase family protein [Gemmatimonadota bacterium]|nr:glycerophosphodiester phosphodiesterase family protein [Gemmatimonadota bacterium]
MTAVIAHRGAAAEAPENSLEALDLGMELGADAIELDVRRTADGALLVIHDPTLDRTTDASGRIADYTRAELADVRLPNGAPIPELGDVLRRFEGVEITVDVKESEAAADVVALVRALGRVEHTILYVEQGTDTPAFRDYEGRRATSTEQATRLALEADWVASAAPREVPEVVHTPLEWRGVPIVTQAFVGRVKKAGRSVQAWTIDDAETAVRLANWGIDGIITNDVRGVRARLDAAARRKADD